MARTAGVVLIALGILILVWGGINYTTREKVLDIGPIEATKESHKRVPLPPLAGVASLIAGAVLLASGRKS